MIPPIEIKVDELDLLSEDLVNKEVRSDPAKCAQLDLKKWLFEKRLDYAQKFFDHHAKQRMSMFQFFLLFVGLMVSGYGNLLKDKWIATGFAGLGMLLTVIFNFLDRRNEELVHVAEDVLESLESDVLFANYNRPIRWPRRRGWFGGMQCLDYEHRELGIFRRQVADDLGVVVSASVGEGKERSRTIERKYPEPRKSKYEHGTWLPLFQVGIFVMFLVFALFPWKDAIMRRLCGD